MRDITGAGGLVQIPVELATEDHAVGRHDLALGFRLLPVCDRCRIAGDRLPAERSDPDDLGAAALTPCHGPPPVPSQSQTDRPIPSLSDYQRIVFFLLAGSSHTM